MQTGLVVAPWCRKTWVVYPWRDYTVRGQSNVWRLPKYCSPIPSPPGVLVRGEDTLAALGGEGVGGQYFGRRQTKLCTLHMKVLCGFTQFRMHSPSSKRSHRTSCNHVRWYNILLWKTIKFPITQLRVPHCVQINNDLGVQYKVVNICYT